MGELVVIFFGVVVTMLLWNWPMPDIFGLQRINFWQAAGLCLLSSLLFRSWFPSSKDEKETTCQPTD